MIQALCKALQRVHFEPSINSDQLSPGPEARVREFGKP